MTFMLLCLFLVLMVAQKSVCSLEEMSQTRRTVMAWASGTNPAAVTQLQNSSWAGVIDGVQAFCGATFRSDGTGLNVNQTQWAQSSALRETARAQGIKFYLVIGGKVPDEQDPKLVIDAAVALAKTHNLDGFSLDDEYDCSPRSTLKRLEHWMMEYVDAFALGLHDAGLELSAAVQAMFGIQDVPYRPYCKPDASPAECSQSCRDHPSAYPLEPRVVELLSNSKVDRWLEMDTYYFTTGRFLNALDWYVNNIPRDKLGVAMMNRNDLSEDGLLARFHAIDKSGSDWINIFMLPVDDMFLPFLRRWKSHCVGCGVQSMLGCYDLTVACSHDEAQAFPVEHS